MLFLSNYELITYQILPQLKVSIRLVSGTYSLRVRFYIRYLWIGLDVSCGHPDWIWLDCIHKFIDWIGLGQQKMDPCPTLSPHDGLMNPSLRAGVVSHLQSTCCGHVTASSTASYAMYVSSRTESSARGSRRYDAAVSLMAAAASEERQQFRTIDHRCNGRNARL